MNYDIETAEGRIGAYLAAMVVAHGKKCEHIHGISSGPEGMQALLVSDIRKVLREREEAFSFLKDTARNMQKMVKVYLG